MFLYATKLNVAPLLEKADISFGRGVEIMRGIAMDRLQEGIVYSNGRVAV